MTSWRRRKTATFTTCLIRPSGRVHEPLFITHLDAIKRPEHILSQLIDDGLAGNDPTIVCHLHAADDDCALDDERQWKKANPALGIFRDRDDLAAAVEKAKRMPADEAEGAQPVA